MYHGICLYSNLLCGESSREKGYTKAAKKTAKRAGKVHFDFFAGIADVFIIFAINFQLRKSALSNLSGELGQKCVSDFFFVVSVWKIANNSIFVSFVRYIERKNTLLNVSSDMIGWR